jgi:hypothetical protein
LPTLARIHKRRLALLTATETWVQDEAWQPESWTPPEALLQANTLW